MKLFLLAAVGIIVLINGSFATYPIENEKNQIYKDNAEEPMERSLTDQIYTISWRTEGDTIVITGEGQITGDNLMLLRLQMDGIKHVRFENCKIYGKMRDLFMGLDTLESIDFTGLDTSQVTKMNNLFYGCSALTSLDLSGFNTTQVEDMTSMFEGCINLESLDLSSFDTSHTTNMFAMFRGCSALKTLDISTFNMADTISLYMLDDCTPALIRTPRELGAGNEITLSGRYCNPAGMTTEKITQDFASTLLIRIPENADITDGIPFAVHEGYTFLIDTNQQVRCYNTDGRPVINDFKCDGIYTYYFQLDGTAMKDRLSYHPDGVHVIYFDKFGHEVFSDFVNVKQNIEGYSVDDLCFFNTYGYMYVDTLTYDRSGTKLYYVNPYGVLEHNGWFQFSGKEFDMGLGFSGRSGGYGYANSDCSLLVNTTAMDWYGQPVYIQADGHMFYN